ncbi:hypothetical protein TNCV_4830061 [Trichonephila clavipes]|nr:hypothetical protein TNCV_4830061 [Trichonephila clavipes]
MVFQQRSEVIQLENFPLKAVHELQYNRLNYQIDVQIGSQGVCDNHESAPASPSDQHMVITCTKAEPDFARKHSTPSSKELWLDTADVVNGNGLESVEYTLQGT